ncbi:hypothetical protein [Microbacterium lacticum]
MIIDPTKEDREALEREVALLLDLPTIRFPKVSRPVFAKAAKRMPFAKNSTQGALASVCEFLLVDDQFERVFPIARALGRIDMHTWIIDYIYVRGIIHHTAYVAQRLSLFAEAAELEQFLRVPADYFPQPRLMEGKGLRLPFSEENMALWAAQPVDMSSTIIGEAYVDLSYLSTMWLFGGSAEWPRERIDAFYDETVANITALPAWSIRTGLTK